MKIKTSDITVDIKPSLLVLTAIVDGKNGEEYICLKYSGYTKKEAIINFKNYIKEVF